MVDQDAPVHAGNVLFEAFLAHVKQVLEHLYDFAYLQQHPLARIYDRDGDLSAKTAGRQLRRELIAVIESLKPHSGEHFRAPVVRLYNILHLYYVENLTIQEVAVELGLSERQAYRDLRRGQESIAAVLWEKRLPQAEQESVTMGDFSFDSEIARLEPDFSMVDLGELVQQAVAAVDRLAQGRKVEITISSPSQPLILSTDASIAHQVIVSLLSYAVQQALPGALAVALTSDRSGTMLTLHFSARRHVEDAMSAIGKLAQRIQWKLVFTIEPKDSAKIMLDTAPEKTTLFIIDDNEGWIELVGRFLEGFDCTVISPAKNQDIVTQAQDRTPSAIMLDVMMPRRDGWEILQRLRAQPSTANIPIIVCSVFNDPQLAYSLGASAFVAKPANRETLLETLQQLDVI